ncbi:TonB-dependent receptor [Pacificimonas sp. ICDLI1SI03]
MSRSSTGRPATSASFVALGCVGFLATAPALAQDAEPAAEATQLQGVVVTDSAIEEEYKTEKVQSRLVTAPLLDTPRTVDVITSAVLESTASYSLQEALRTVPGITLGAGEGGVAAADIPLIRGVDATSDTYVDGARDVGSQLRETFAVERIEVFKGPNAALGGRGGAGGSLNIVSKLPVDGNHAIAQGTVGTDDFYRATVDVNQQVNDFIGVRINALYQDADVPGRDAIHDDRWGIAPSVTLGMNSPTKMTLFYYHYETDGVPDYGIPLTSREQLPGGIREPADVDPDNFYGLLVRDFQETQVDSAEVLIEHDFGNGWAISNIARYGRSKNEYIVTNPDDSAGNVVDGAVWRAIKSRGSVNKSLVDNLTLSGDFATGSLSHSIAIGGEYTYSDTSNRNFSVDTGDRNCPADAFAQFNCTDLQNPNPADPWNGAISRSATPSVAEATSFGIYAFDTVTIVPQLLLNGGIRWETFKVEAAGSGRGGAYDVEAKNDFVTWQAGIIYKPTDLTSLYFSYADSANPPGADVGEGSSGINAGNEFYEPQRNENWEVGAKADLLDGALSLTGAVFQIDRDNVINQDPIAGPIPIADKARIRGAEVGVRGQLGPVALLAGYSYLDSEVKDGSPEDGNRLPQTPKHNVAMTATWQATPRFSLGGGAYHASERFADTGNLIRADAYWRFDAHAEYQLSDHLGVRLNVQNVGDERYITQLRNPHFAVPARGRQALLTLTGRL